MEGIGILDNDKAEVVYRVWPLLQLTSLQDMTFSLGHLSPSAAKLSSLTQLTAVDLCLPGLPSDDDDDDDDMMDAASLRLRYEPSLDSGFEAFQSTVDAHTSLFTLASLRYLGLSGPLVHGLQGIEMLTNLKSLLVGGTSWVTDVSPLSRLSSLRYTMLACPNVGSLAPLLSCNLLSAIKLNNDQQLAKLPPRIKDIASILGS